MKKAIKKVQKNNEQAHNATVWVIVLNWNGWRDTLACLDSLKAVQQPTLHILVVDNGSTNGSQERIREYLKLEAMPHVTELIENSENLGFAGGMNTGLKAGMDAGAEWLLVLNNDTIVDPHFLTKMLAAAATNKRIGMLNPKIMLTEPPDHIWSVGSTINWMRTKGTHIGYNEEDHGQYDQPSVRDTAYTTGGCLLVKREVIEAIGYLPEEYFVYYEDGEWSTSAQRAGWRTVVVPAAKIWHKGAASAGEHSSAYIRYHVRNGLLFAKRTGNPLQVAAAFLWSVPRAAWQVVKWILWPEKRLWAKAILAGIADAWLGRTGKINRTYT